MSDLRSLVRRGRDLDRDIKDKTEELKAIKARLIEAGAGDHAGTDGASAKVTFPAPTLKPDETGVAFARKKLGKLFGKVFVETVSYKPVKAFREIVGVLLPESDAGEVIAACEVDSAPQVRFS